MSRYPNADELPGEPRLGAASGTRRWLGAALALSAAYGAVQGWAAGSGTTGAWPARVAALAYPLLMLPLPYLWLRADAAARGFRRGTALSGAVIGLPWLGVPWYLLRSRPRGRRARAVLKALAFGLLAIPGAYLAGGAPLALLLGGW